MTSTDQTESDESLSPASGAFLSRWAAAAAIVIVIIVVSVLIIVASPGKQPVAATTGAPPTIIPVAALNSTPTLPSPQSTYVNEAQPYPQPIATADRPGGQPTDYPTAIIPIAPSLPAPTGTVLFADDFSSDTISRYTITDVFHGDTYKPGNWNVKNGMLNQLFDSDGNISEYEETAALVGQSNWANYTVEAYNYHTGTPPGVIARYSASGFYCLCVNGDQWDLERVDHPGVENPMSLTVTSLAGGAISNTSYTRHSWNYLAISVQGNRISGSINGKPVGQAVDATYPAGLAGVYAGDVYGTMFDNLRVTQSAERP